MSTPVSEKDSQKLFEFYRYKPSIVAAIIFIFAFSIMHVIHAIQVWRSRNWICLCLAFGAFWEVTSYIIRIFSAKQSPNHTLGIYIAQGSGSLLAPAIFAATIYVCLGRIIASVDGEKYSIIRLSWLTRFFIAGDMIGLGVQACGAIFMPRGGYANYITGSNITIAGLALLLAYIALFIITAAIFHIRIHLYPTPLSSLPSKNWQKDMIVLYATSFLIMVRSIYRLVEYSGGNNSLLMRAEWTLYVLDATLMWLVLVVFAVWQPMRKGAKEGDEERKGEFGLKAWMARGKKGGESVGSEEVALD